MAEDQAAGVPPAAETAILALGAGAAGPEPAAAPRGPTGYLLGSLRYFCSRLLPYHATLKSSGPYYPPSPGPWTHSPTENALLFLFPLGPSGTELPVGSFPNEEEARLEAIFC